MIIDIKMGIVLFRVHSIISTTISTITSATNTNNSTNYQ